MKTLAVQKGQPIGFSLKKNNKKDFKIKHGATWQIFRTLQKTWTLQKKKKIDGFLNCYHFAYTGRDTANIAISQLNRIALGLIRKTSNLESEIDQIAQTRIKQVINQGGWEIGRVAPKTIRVAINELYKMSFQLLGQFGWRKVTATQLKPRTT